MNKKNMRVFIGVIIALGIVTWLLLVLRWSKGGLILVEPFKRIPTAITINTVFWAVFAKWLWRWKYFKGWLVPFPDLSGTWEGKIISSWISPETSQGIPPIESSVEIKQTFFSLSVVTRTKEMTSKSYAASFVIDDESKIKQVCYSYTSKPKMNIRERSAIHDGTALLEIKGDPANILQGEYWTGRETKGEMIFTKTESQR